MQIISEQALLFWLDELVHQKLVVAPTHVGELTLFRPVTKVGDIVMNEQNTSISPKEWFFPTTESLFTLDTKNSSVPHSSAVVKDLIIFGIRPCDAKGLRLLDLPFFAEPADQAYAERRIKTTLIGLACDRVESQCFCSSMGIGPHYAEDVDIMLIKTGSDYIVQAKTEKGKKLLSSVKLSSSNMAMPPEPIQKKVSTDRIIEATNRVFEDSYWNTLADRCLHCNICSYVCPTCYCFDIRDTWLNKKIERIRTWESCQSPGFSRIAGGYDPRPTKGTKLRQRFCHKLLYFPKQFGPIDCVGCGRCVNACPVKIDIREVIANVQERGEQIVNTRT